MDACKPEDHASSEPAAPLSNQPERRSAALPDPPEISRRVTEDETAADDARARYRAEGPGKLRADERLAALLERDEWLIAVRTSAILDRREPRAGVPARPGLVGQLSVTSRRLILAGRHVLSFELAEVQEIVLSGDRLLVVMRNGVGIALDVDQPRLLRVQIAAARAAARS